MNPTGAPVAFTVKVISFDGTPISTNFFPASGLQTGESANTILEGPGLGSAGTTDPLSTDGILSIPGLVPGIAPLRDAGYNVVTWDPRGEYASGGVLQLDSPDFEAKDVSAIIDMTLALPETDGHQRIGMVGGSYGGGIQLVTATIDPRINAIVPGIAWNTLNSSLYPKDVFKSAWGTLLTLDLLEAGATDQSPDLRGHPHRCSAGLPDPEPAGVAGPQRHGYRRRQDHRPDAADPGHRRRAVPLAGSRHQPAAADRRRHHR